MVNKWVEHIKTFAKKNNLTYACALSNKECINSYKKLKDKPVEVINTPIKSKKQIALDKQTAWFHLPSKQESYIPGQNKNWREEQKIYKRGVKRFLNSQTSNEEVKWRRDHDLKMAEEKQNIKKVEELSNVRRKKKSGAIL